MANPLVGNEILYVQGLDGSGKPSAVTEAVTTTQFTNFEGSTYLVNSVSVINTVVLSTSGMTVNLQAAGVYVFDVYLSTTNGGTGGIKLAFAGTATATSISADTWAYNTATVVAQGNITALSSSLVAVTNTVTTVNICGTIVVATAGTFGLSFAQNVVNSTTAVTLNAGSNFWVDRLS